MFEHYFPVDLNLSVQCETDLSSFIVLFWSVRADCSIWSRM